MSGRSGAPVCGGVRAILSGWIPGWYRISAPIRAQEGLRGPWSTWEVPITELEVEDPGIYLDADTPQDYMNLRYWNDYSQIQKQGPKNDTFPYLNRNDLIGVWKWSGVPRRWNTGHFLL